MPIKIVRSCHFAVKYKTRGLYRTIIDNINNTNANSHPVYYVLEYDYGKNRGEQRGANVKNPRKMAAIPAQTVYGPGPARLKKCAAVVGKGEIFIYNPYRKGPVRPCMPLRPRKRAAGKKEG